jgi:hypothetical protein
VSTGRNLSKPRQRWQIWGHAKAAASENSRDEPFAFSRNGFEQAATSARDKNGSRGKKQKGEFFEMMRLEL